MPLILDDDEIEERYLKYLRKQEADRASLAREGAVASLLNRLLMLIRPRRGSIA